MSEIKEVSRNIDEVGRRVDALTGKWGRFVEGLIVPAAEWLFAERGIPVHTVSQRVRSRRHGGEMEIGVLVVNQGHVVLIEAKSTLGADDVNEHLDRIACFKDFFPEYADRQVLGAVAGIEITGDADKYAYRKGLFVIAQSGDGVKILNDARFRPRTW